MSIDICSGKEGIETTALGRGIYIIKTRLQQIEYRHRKSEETVKKDSVPAQIPRSDRHESFGLTIK